MVFNASLVKSTHIFRRYSAGKADFVQSLWEGDIDNQPFVQEITYGISILVKILYFKMLL